jgi:hypothetical protein
VVMAKRSTCFSAPIKRKSFPRSNNQYPSGGPSGRLRSPDLRVAQQISASVAIRHSFWARITEFCPYCRHRRCRRVMLQMVRLSPRNIVNNASFDNQEMIGDP